MIDREALDKIIRINGGDNWWHPDLFKLTTLLLLPKDLKILKIPPQKDNYNCFIYSLNLVEVDIIRDCNGFIYDTFVSKLIAENKLIITDIPKDGDYVLYRDSIKHPTVITHIGTLRKGKIISKWAWGPLVEHELFDVPASYGDTVFYIKKITSYKARALYFKYKEFNIL